MTRTGRLPYYRVDGPEEAPALVLGPSLGTSLDIWEPQLAALARHHRVLRYDLPGHGGSATGVLPDPAPGRTTVADLARLVLALADREGLDSFHYAGISLGGAVGVHLAVRHPERVSSLALICSSARFGDAGPWRQRAALVREEGTTALAGSAPGRWFADPATAASPRGSALLSDLAAAEPAGYAACCDALAGYDLRTELRRIGAPTLVVAGSSDVAAPLADARELAEGIPGASMAVVDAGHLAGVEQPERVTALLARHLGASARPERGQAGPFPR